jgi:hypothetical protein
MQDNADEIEKKSVVIQKPQVREPYFFCKFRHIFVIVSWERVISHFNIALHLVKLNQRIAGTR